MVDDRLSMRMVYRVGFEPSMADGGGEGNMSSGVRKIRVDV